MKIIVCLGMKTILKIKHFQTIDSMILNWPMILRFYDLKLQIHKAPDPIV